MAKDFDNEYLIRLVHHLQKLRKSKKLSLRKLAAKCNIEHADILRYEKGEINMTFMTLVELSNGLEITKTLLIRKNRLGYIRANHGSVSVSASIWGCSPAAGI